MPTFDGNQAMFNENAGNIYQALEFRRNYHAMNNGKAGVLRDNDFLCSISTTNIIVAYGSAYINDSLTLAISQYFARTVDDTASTTLAVTPNNTLLARNDLVTLRVLDTARGDASDNCAIVIETGVAVSSFARSLVLASFTVAAGANVATALIDTRQFAGTYQGVQRCTSTTQPSLPSRGEFIYETNTYKLQQYTTAATSWQPPWNLPWGVMGVSSTTATSASTAATIIDTGLSIAYSHVANRRYRYSYSCQAFPTAAGQVDILVTNSANTNIGLSSSRIQLLASQIGTVSKVFYFSPTTSAAVTHKCRFFGSVLCSLYGDGNYSNSFIIEDIGPSANPA
jgi:hypothetical protein